MLRHRFEYAFVLALFKVFSALPRAVARSAGAGLLWCLSLLPGRLQAVGDRNLRTALPELDIGQRRHVLRAMYRHLGWHLAEFCQMRRYSRGYVAANVMRYEGLAHYLSAAEAGRGVLVLTAHLGAWELSSFAHSLMGHPMGMVIRRLDNPLVDRLVNELRCMHGNRVLHKDDFARGLLRAMAAGETVGILMDTNMTPPQGVFVPFFGVQACTASGLARVARKSGAAVVPGFLLWHAEERRYVLHFGAPLSVQQTEDVEADAVANTAHFTKVTEEYVRRYPEQWLWLHRRWKTRPPGEASLYGD